MQDIFKLRIGEDNLDETAMIMLIQQDTLPRPKGNVEYYSASTSQHS